MSLPSGEVNTAVLITTTLAGRICKVALIGAMKSSAWAVCEVEPSTNASSAPRSWLPILELGFIFFRLRHRPYTPIQPPPVSCDGSTCPPIVFRWRSRASLTRKGRESLPGSQLDRDCRMPSPLGLEVRCALARRAANTAWPEADRSRSPTGFVVAGVAVTLTAFLADSYSTLDSRV